MIYDFDLYNHPESSTDVKNQLKILNEQLKIVEGLQHARSRLTATRSLESNTLSKCNVFMHYVNNSTPGSNFNLEVRKLSLDELAFCSISFEERRLKSVIHHFKATDIRTYMTTMGISCLDRSEIFTRLKRLSTESEGKPFHEVYTASFAVHNTSLQSGSINFGEQMNDETLLDPEPDTTAKQPGAFEFPTARWENIDKVLPLPAANAVRHVPPRIIDPEITDCVRSRFPRGRDDGDAIIWLDLGSVGIWPLLHNSGRGIGTAHIREIFGDTIANAIEESDLRKWEKRIGRMDTTECVKMKLFCHVELRIAYDTTIAKMLFN